MASRARTKGFAERVADSARGMADGLMPSGVGLERGMGELALSRGKTSSMDVPAGVTHMSDYYDREGGFRTGRETIRSEVNPGKFEEEFLEFELSTGSDMLDDFDFDQFLACPPISASSPLPQVQDQCVKSTAHTLPAELRSLALSRLRQIEGHISTSEASKEAQRRAELENEWLLWWDESPTACFDDSREYFANDAQRSYTEAWENHLARPPLASGQRPDVKNAHGIAHDMLEPLPSHPPQQHVFASKEQQSPRCQNRKSHENLIACRRSMPIAAQHRPCPHAGCGFCSETSAGWFEHLRECRR